VRMKPLGAVAFVVCFVLLSAAPVHAEWPSIQARGGPPSGIVHRVFNGLRKPGAQHHRTVASTPLPRPRPPELPREAAGSNRTAPEGAPLSAEARKVLEGGPAPTSNQNLGANRTPAESAPEVAPASDSNTPPVAPTSVEAGKVLEVPPALTSYQTSDANSRPAESPIDLANAPAEVAAPVEANEAPAAELPASGSNKTTPELLPPAVAARPNEAEALAPIND
jgi:hypothetical protein